MSACTNLYKYIVPTGLRPRGNRCFYKYIVPMGLTSIRASSTLFILGKTFFKLTLIIDFTIFLANCQSPIATTK